MNKALIGLLCLTIVFFSSQMFSQEEEAIPQLPQIVPVSPEAASLGKYGDVPVNLSMGKVNYTIPIYSIRVGDLEFPLTLSYNYGGFMPEEEPTMIGMGWSANFSGAIIRKIAGKADEKSNLGYLSLSNYFQNFNSLSQGDKDLTVVNSGKNFWDSHPDSYVIQSPIIEGTFRFRDDTTPIFMPYRNHKVSVLDYNTPGFNGFDITDDKGTIFTFDVFEETEQESLDGDADILSYRSSWMLSEINFPNSTDQIAFFYDDYYHEVLSQSRYRTKKLTGNSGPNCGTCKNSSVMLSENETRINAKTLSRIDFPNGYILFNQELYQPNPLTGSSQRPILRDLTVYDSNDRQIEKFLFTYHELQDYHFLTGINKVADNGDLLQLYSFDYYDLNQVPNTKVVNDRTDLWGFYNDVLFDPDGIVSKNPNFEKTRIGALKNITYPTKGSTEITYESNSITRSGDLYDSCNPIFDASENISIDSGDYAAPTYCPSASDPVEKTITIPFAQVVKVDLTVTTADSGAETYASFTKISSTTNTALNYTCSLEENLPVDGVSVLILAEDGDEGPIDDQLRQNTVKYVNVGPGTYKLYLEVCGNGGQSTTARGIVRYRTTAYTGQESTAEIGGIRVAQTKDCPGGNADCITKNYHYINENEPESSSGILLANPKFTSFEVEKFGNQSGNCREQTEYFSSVIPLATYNGSHVLYKRVEIVNDNGDNGKTVNYYTGTKDTDPSPYFPALTSVGRSIRRGKLEKQELLKASTNGFSLVRKTENFYDDYRFNSDLSVLDLFAVRYEYIFAETTLNGSYSCSGTGNDNPDDYEYAARAYFPEDHRLQYSIDTLYFETGKIAQRTDYLYDPLYGMTKEITTSLSDGTSRKTSLEYANDLNNASLILQHRIGTPIVTTALINDIPTSESTQVFSNFGNKYLVNKVQTLKGTYSSGSNELQDRVVFHDYDNKGNVKEVSREKGAHTYYVWGYGHQYPIAKIENVSYEDMSTAQLTLISNVETASDNDDDRTVDTMNPNGTKTYVGNEGALRESQDLLRAAFADALITTYTYDPLIGPTSMTDTRGYTTYYTYDGFNRLKEVKDAENLLIEDYKYQYKTQD